MVDPIGLLRNLFEFIGVDGIFADEHLSEIATMRHNVSDLPKSRALHNFLDYPNPLKTIFKPLHPPRPAPERKKRLWHRNLVRPQLSPEMRRDLAALYRGDILRLQELIGRDLSAWIEE